MMDKMAITGKAGPPGMEAALSEDALMAYMDESPYGHWVICQYAHWGDDDREAFRKGMNEVLPYVGNRDAFMARLKFSAKKDCCRTLALDCAFNDLMAFSESECTLTDVGYESLKDKYAKELDEELEWMAKIHAEKT